MLTSSRRKDMRFTVYKTTNNLNGRFYIGVHRTENPNDSYLGSGKALTLALRKYGRAAFTKEVLHDFDTAEEMMTREREIVNEAFLSRQETYNIVRGGQSCFSAMSGAQLSALAQQGNRAFQDKLKDPEYRATFAAKAGRPGDLNGFYGRSHSEDTLSKMRTAKAGQGEGKRNSQFGTAWVCREGEAPRKIKKTELPAFTEAGWQRGRKVRP